MDRLELKKLYIDEVKSISDISIIKNVSKSKIRNWLKTYSMLRTRPDGIRAARHKLGKHRKGKKFTFTKEHIDKIREAALRRHEKTAKGISLKPSGYYEITRGANKGRNLHCVIMEIHIGRKLKENEVVHHVNEVKSDNRIENLMLMTKSEHSRYHAKERVIKGVNYDISKHSEKGERHPKSILKESQVIEIIKSELSYMKLSEKYKVSKSCIKHIKNRRTWKHIKIN